MLALFLTQRCDLETNFPSIGVKAQCHGGTARQNDQLRQLLVVAQRFGEARAAGEHFHLTHLPGYLQDDDGQAAQRLCRLLQGLLHLRVARGTQLLAQPFFCDLLVAAEQHVDDALVKACLFECFEKGEALAGLVIAPDQHGGAIMQVQQPADLGLAQPWSMKNKAHEDLRMMPGLDVLARDLHVGLGSVEGAVDHPIHDSIAIFFFLLALYVRLPLIVHSHYERQSTSDPQPREEGLASRHHCSEASMHRYKASGQLGPFRVCCAV